MIRCWRESWHEELPFLFVQLAPFRRWLQCTGDGYAQLREKQQLVADKVANTYMISIMDLGMADDIHPKKKKEVGERLAVVAKGKIYGKDILCESPRVTRVRKEKEQLILEVSNCGEGLRKVGDDFTAFELWKKEKIMETNNVIIKQKCIIIPLTIDEEEEIEIRYAFKDYVEVDIYNSIGLPLIPFCYRIKSKK